jgi:N-acyl-L-homoserine lactone synthetase
MVEVISKENAHLYADVLDDMHQMRYRVAVEEWGWRIPGIEPGYDKDEFDTDETIHFVCLDTTETRVVACGRLNPTTGPHLLSEKFRDHVEGALPSDPAIYELSRYIVDHRSLSKEQQFAVRGRISSAFNLFCLQSGIRQITVLTYMSSYARSVKFWPTRPLGLPVFYKQDNASYIAAICDMTPLGLERLREGFGLSKDEPHLHTRVESAAVPCMRRIRAAVPDQFAAA